MPRRKVVNPNGTFLGTKKNSEKLRTSYEILRLFLILLFFFFIVMGTLLISAIIFWVIIIMIWRDERKIKRESK
jgi:phage shock protein PspC (stress-responsive transcriptional regulator)